MHQANTWTPQESDMYSASGVPTFLSPFFQVDATTGVLQYKTGSGMNDIIPGKTFFFGDYTKPGADVDNPDCYVYVIPNEGEAPTGNTRLVAI